jgi:hypothetical protein
VSSPRGPRTQAAARLYYAFLDGLVRHTGGFTAYRAALEAMEGYLTIPIGMAAMGRAAMNIGDRDMVMTCWQRLRPVGRPVIGRYLDITINVCITAD